MEFMIVQKGSKYIVQDKKSRLLYSVKKKGFGANRLNLLDASDYILYTLVQTDEGRKPAFTILLNDQNFLTITCRSLFLDPTLDAVGSNMKFALVSKDRKDFVILKNDAAVGSIKTLQTVSGDLHYEIQVDNAAFDDYIPLFAVAIDKAFGDMNKS